MPGRSIRAAIASLLAVISHLSGAEELTVVSWDGAYVRSQMLGFIRPYEQLSGITVEVIPHNGGVDEIRRQVRAENVRWDVVDMEMFDAIRACNEGLLEEIDTSTLPPAPDGTPAEDDFIGPSLMRCGIGNVVGSTVIGFDSRRLRQAPEKLEDFFDLRRFPGRRGLRATPQVNLEWALIADGVDPKHVYSVLGTEEGLLRAFAVLERIKPYVDWWERGEEAIRLLETGRVQMSSVYSGRVFDAVQRGANLEILWDHQVWFYDVWAIPKHGTRTAVALEFIRFATSTESLARQASYIPYGPVRRSALALVDEDMRERLPTAEANLRTALEIDAQWWAANLERIERRFQRWLQQPVMVPRELPR